jgi:uncharacterized membrane protein YtjA (UPF0391 family)
LRRTRLEPPLVLRVFEAPSGVHWVIPADNANEGPMLYWALVFLIIAIVAGALGFGGLAATAGSIAHILFFVFLVFFVIALVGGLMARRGPPL